MRARFGPGRLQKHGDNPFRPGFRAPPEGQENLPLPCPICDDPIDLHAKPQRSFEGDINALLNILKLLQLQQRTPL